MKFRTCNCIIFYLDVFALVVRNARHPVTVWHGNSVGVGQRRVESRHQEFVPVGVFNVSHVVGVTLQVVTSHELTVDEHVEFTTEVPGNVEVLGVQPEGEGHTEIVVEVVETNVLEEVVHLVLAAVVIASKFATAAGVVGVDQVGVGGFHSGPLHS